MRFARKMHDSNPPKHVQESPHLHLWVAHTLHQRQTYHTLFWAMRYLRHYAHNTSMHHEAQLAARYLAETTSTSVVLKNLLSCADRG